MKNEKSFVTIQSFFSKKDYQDKKKVIFAEKL